MGKQIFTLTHPLNRKNQSSVFTLSQITIALSVEPLTVAAQSLPLSDAFSLSPSLLNHSLSGELSLSPSLLNQNLSPLLLILSLSREFSVSLSLVTFQS